MNIQGKTVWQIAAGNGEHTHYAKLCIDADVIILGPGKFGPWPECEIDVRRERGGRMAGIIRRFAMDMKRGDIVVLRVGTQHVYGVGEVAGDYDWSDLFGNVQGWDLQHYRRVRWLWHQDGKPKSFPAYTLKFGSSVQYVISMEVLQWLKSLHVPEHAHDRSLKPL